MSGGKIAVHITAVEPGIALFALLGVLRFPTGHEDLLGAIGIALLKRTALLPGDAGGEHLRLGFLEEVVALHRIF